MFALRDYQKKALVKINKSLKMKKNVLLSAIMSAGKTVMVARLVNKYYFNSNKRFLILAHKMNLVDQFYKTFLKFTDIPKKEIGICCSSIKKNKSLDNRLTLGTIQSFVGSMDDYGSCDLLVIDEVHKAFFTGFSQYSQAYDYLRASKSSMRFLGVTATPYRMDQGYCYGDVCKDAKLNVFKEIDHKITYKELLEKKHVCDIIGKISISNDLENDLETVNTNGVNGDYILDELANVMIKAENINNVRESIENYAKNRKCICIVCVTIAHAEAVYKAFLDSPMANTITIVHSKLSMMERTINMRSWESGKKRIMISVNLLLEGYDLPKLDCLVLARDTKSPSLFVQIVGRIMRTCEGKKNGLLIDLTTNTNRFGLDLDNVKIKIPKNRAKEEKKEAFEKICPSCQAVCHTALRECVECGFIFDQKEILKFEASMPEFKSVKFSGEFIEEDIEPRWYEVDSCSMDVHTSKKTKKELGIFSIEYYNKDVLNGYNALHIYFCLPDQYKGYAVKKAKEQWYEFCKDDMFLGDVDFPDSIKEWKEIMDTFNCYAPCPKEILIDESEKFPKMVDYKLKKDSRDKDKDTAETGNIGMSRESQFEIEDDYPF